MRRLTSLLIVGATIGKTLGFARELLLAHALGVSITADSFHAALSIVFLPLALFQGDLIVTIPLYNKWRPNPTKYTMLIFGLTAITVLLTVLVVVSARSWVAVMVGGFSEPAVDMTINFVRIMALAMPATVLFNFLASIEIAVGRVRLTSFRASTQNIAIMTGIIVGMVTGSNYGIPVGFAIAMNLTAFYGLVTLLQSKDLIVSGGSLPIMFACVREYFRDLRNIVVQTVSEQTGAWVERYYSSAIQGTVAAMDYARTLTDCTTYLISQPIGVAVLVGDSSRDRTLSLARIMLTLTLPASVVLAILAPVIVQVVLQRGAFEARAVGLTSQALAGIAIGSTWAGTIAYILLRQLFKERQVRTAVLVFAGSYGVNIGFNVINGVTGIGPFGFGLGESLRGFCLLAGTSVALGCGLPILRVIVISAPSCLILGMLCYQVQQYHLSSLVVLPIAAVAYVIVVLPILQVYHRSIGILAIGMTRSWLRKYKT